MSIHSCLSRIPGAFIAIRISSIIQGAVYFHNYMYLYPNYSIQSCKYKFREIFIFADELCGQCICVFYTIHTMCVYVDHRATSAFQFSQGSAFYPNNFPSSIWYHSRSVTSASMLSQSSRQFYSSPPGYRTPVQANWNLCYHMLQD